MSNFCHNLKRHELGELGETDEVEERPLLFISKTLIIKYHYRMGTSTWRQSRHHHQYLV